MKRTVAAALALLYFIGNVALSHALEFNSYRAVSSPFTFPSSSSVLPVSKDLSAYGTVRKQRSPSGSRLTVFHIQDIHGHREAQENMSRLAASLMEHEQVDLLALEGLFGPIDLSSDIQDEPSIQQVAADFLLFEDVLTGPLHAALVAKNKPTVIGVDDERHHRLNVEAYRQSKANEDRLRKVWSTMNAALEEKKKFTINAELADYDRAVQSYHSGSLGLGEYLKNFPEIEPLSQLELFQTAWSMETKLSMPQVEAERGRLLVELTQKLSVEDTKVLTERAAAFGAGRINHTVFYETVLRLCRTKGVLMSRYPAMDAYWRYLQLADRIDGVKLLAEIKAAEESRAAGLIQSSAERELITESRRMMLAGKLLSFELTPEEWADYKSLGRPSGLNLGSFEDFYRQAEARDEAMANNLLQAAHDKKAVILVTGGFHARGLHDRLLKAGVNVVTVTPKISKAEGSSDYLNVFRREKTPLEKLFAGQRLFLSRVLWTSADQSQWAAVKTSLAAAKSGVEKTAPGPLQSEIRAKLHPSAEVRGTILYPAAARHVRFVLRKITQAPGLSMIYSNPKLMFDRALLAVSLFFIGWVLYNSSPVERSVYGIGGLAIAAVVGTRITLTTFTGRRAKSIAKSLLDWAQQLRKELTLEELGEMTRGQVLKIFGIGEKSIPVIEQAVGHPLRPDPLPMIRVVRAMYQDLMKANIALFEAVSKYKRVRRHLTKDSLTHPEAEAGKESFRIIAEDLIRIRNEVLIPEDQISDTSRKDSYAKLRTAVMQNINKALIWVNGFKGVQANVILMPVIERLNREYISLMKTRIRGLSRVRVFKPKFRRIFNEKLGKHQWLLELGRHHKHLVGSTVMSDREQGDLIFDSLWDAFRLVDHVVDSELDNAVELRSHLAALISIERQLKEEEPDPMLGIALSRLSNKLHSEVLTEVNLAGLSVETASHLFENGDKGPALSLVTQAISLLQTRQDEIGAIIAFMEFTRAQPMRDYLLNRNRQIKQSIAEIKRGADVDLLQSRIGDTSEPDLRIFQPLLEEVDKAREAKDGKRLNTVYKLLDQKIENAELLQAFMPAYRAAYTLIRIDPDKEDLSNTEIQKQAFIRTLDWYVDHYRPKNVNQWLYRLYHAVFISPHIDNPEKKSERIANPLFEGMGRVLDMLDVKETSLVLSGRYGPVPEALRPFSRKKFLVDLTPDERRQVLDSMAPGVADQLKTALDIRRQFSIPGHWLPVKRWPRLGLPPVQSLTGTMGGERVFGFWMPLFEELTRYMIIGHFGTAGAFGFACAHAFLHFAWDIYWAPAEEQITWLEFLLIRLWIRLGLSLVFTLPYVSLPVQSAYKFDRLGTALFSIGGAFILHSFYNVEFRNSLKEAGIKIPVMSLIGPGNIGFDDIQRTLSSKEAPAELKTEMATELFNLVVGMQKMKLTDSQMVKLTSLLNEPLPDDAQEILATVLHYVQHFIPKTGIANLKRLLRKQQLTHPRAVEMLESIVEVHEQLNGEVSDSKEARLLTVPPDATIEELLDIVYRGESALEEHRADAVRLLKERKVRDNARIGELAIDLALGRVPWEAHVDAVEILKRVQDKLPPDSLTAIAAAIRNQTVYLRKRDPSLTELLKDQSERLNNAGLLFVIETLAENVPLRPEERINLAEVLANRQPPSRDDGSLNEEYQRYVSWEPPQRRFIRYLHLAIKRPANRAIADKLEPVLASVRSHPWPDNSRGVQSWTGTWGGVHVYRFWMPLLEESLRWASIYYGPWWMAFAYAGLHAFLHFYVDIYAARGDHLTWKEFLSGRLWVRFGLSLLFSLPYLLLLTSHPPSQFSILSFHAFQAAQTLHVINNSFNKLVMSIWPQSKSQSVPNLRAGIETELDRLEIKGQARRSLAAIADRDLPELTSWEKLRRIRGLNQTAAEGVMKVVRDYHEAASIRRVLYIPTSHKSIADFNRHVAQLETALKESREQGREFVIFMDYAGPDSFPKKFLEPGYEPSSQELKKAQADFATESAHVRSEFEKAVLGIKKFKVGVDNENFLYALLEWASQNRVKVILEATDFDAWFNRHISDNRSVEARKFARKTGLATAEDREHYRSLMRESLDRLATHIRIREAALPDQIRRLGGPKRDIALMYGASHPIEEDLISAGFTVVKSPTAVGLEVYEGSSLAGAAARVANGVIWNENQEEEFFLKDLVGLHLEQLAQRAGRSDEAVIMHRADILVRQWTMNEALDYIRLWHEGMPPAWRFKTWFDAHPISEEDRTYFGIPLREDSFKDIVEVLSSLAVELKEVDNYEHADSLLTMMEEFRRTLEENPSEAILPPASPYAAIYSEDDGIPRFLINRADLNELLDEVRLATSHPGATEFATVLLKSILIKEGVHYREIAPLLRAGRLEEFVDEHPSLTREQQEALVYSAIAMTMKIEVDGHFDQFKFLRSHGWHAGFGRRIPKDFPDILGGLISAITRDMGILDSGSYWTDETKARQMLGMSFFARFFLKPSFVNNEHPFFPPSWRRMLEWELDAGRLRYDPIEGRYLPNNSRSLWFLMESRFISGEAADEVMASFETQPPEVQSLTGTWGGLHTVVMPYVEEWLRYQALVHGGWWGALAYALIHAALHFYADIYSARGDLLTWKEFLSHRFWKRLAYSLAFTIPYLIPFGTSSSDPAFDLAFTLHHLNNTYGRLVMSWFGEEDVKWKLIGDLRNPILDAQGGRIAAAYDLKRLVIKGEVYFNVEARVRLAEILRDELLPPDAQSNVAEILSFFHKEYELADSAIAALKQWLTENSPRDHRAETIIRAIVSNQVVENLPVTRAEAPPQPSAPSPQKISIKRKRVYAKSPYYVDPALTDEQVLAIFDKGVSESEGRRKHAVQLLAEPARLAAISPVNLAKLAHVFEQGRVPSNAQAMVCAILLERSSDLSSEILHDLALGEKHRVVLLGAKDTSPAMILAKEAPRLKIETLILMADTLADGWPHHVNDKKIYLKIFKDRKDVKHALAHHTTFTSALQAAGDNFHNRSVEAEIKTLLDDFSPPTLIIPGLWHYPIKFLEWLKTPGLAIAGIIGTAEELLVSGVGVSGVAKGIQIFLGLPEPPLMATSLIIAALFMFAHTLGPLYRIKGGKLSSRAPTEEGDYFLIFLSTMILRTWYVLLLDSNWPVSQALLIISLAHGVLLNMLILGLSGAGLAMVPAREKEHQKIKSIFNDVYRKGVLHPLTQDEEADVYLVRKLLPSEKMPRDVRTWQGYVPKIGKRIHVGQGYLGGMRADREEPVLITSDDHVTGGAVEIKSLDLEGRPWIWHAHLFQNNFNDDQDPRTSALQQLLTALEIMKERGHTSITLHANFLLEHSGLGIELDNADSATSAVAGHIHARIYQKFPDVAAHVEIRTPNHPTYLDTVTHSTGFYYRSPKGKGKGINEYFSFEWPNLGQNAKDPIEEIIDAVAIKLEEEASARGFPFHMAEEFIEKSKTPHHRMQLAHKLNEYFARVLPLKGGWRNKEFFIEAVTRSLDLDRGTRGTRFFKLSRFVLDPILDNLIKTRMDSSRLSKNPPFLRIRHVASSDGSEVYTAAFYVNEALKRYYDTYQPGPSFEAWRDSWDIQLDAFDVSLLELEKGKNGSYFKGQTIVWDFQSAGLNRSEYMLANQVRGTFRRWTRWHYLDLADPDQLAALDGPADITFSLQTLRLLRSEKAKHRVFDQIMVPQSEHQLFIMDEGSSNRQHYLGIEPDGRVSLNSQDESYLNEVRDYLGRPIQNDRFRTLGHLRFIGLVARPQDKDLVAKFRNDGDLKIRETAEWAYNRMPDPEEGDDDSGNSPKDPHAGPDLSAAVKSRETSLDLQSYTPEQVVRGEHGEPSPSDQRRSSPHLVVVPEGKDYQAVLAELRKVQALARRAPAEKKPTLRILLTEEQKSWKADLARDLGLATANVIYEGDFADAASFRGKLVDPAKSGGLTFMIPAGAQPSAFTWHYLQILSKENGYKDWVRVCVLESLLQNTPAVVAPLHSIGTLMKIWDELRAHA